MEEFEEKENTETNEENKEEKKHVKLQTFFLEGLLVLLPISATFYIIIFLIEKLYKILKFSAVFLPEGSRELLSYKLIAEVIAFFAIIIITIFLGFIINTIAGKWIKNFFNLILENTPLVKTVYTSLKQVADTFIMQNEEKAFSKVVQLQFPHKGKWALGFLMGKTPKKINPKDNKEYYTIFVPSAPNPSTGFLMMMEKNDFIILEMSIDKALKIIISGGVLKE